MTTLVVGASGATGRQLVEQLLNTGQCVKVIVRGSSKIPNTWLSHSKVSVIEANISEISLEELANHTKECQAVASCLGHNLTLRGIFGKPRKLVADAVKLLCAAIKANSPQRPVKFVLMNTVGNRNRDLTEPVSVGHRLAIALIRLLLPPQSDNEKAADYLREHVGQKNAWIEWVVVRPDSLINEEAATDYELYASPTRSAIFNPGRTSRINVGHFMSRLIVEKDVWDQWKGQMPVIYNKIN